MRVTEILQRRDSITNKQLLVPDSTRSLTTLTHRVTEMQRMRALSAAKNLTVQLNSKCSAQPYCSAQRCSSVQV